MQVMVRDRVLDRVHAEVVGGSVGESSFDAAAGHPHREAVVMMSSADFDFSVCFFERSAAEFGGPDHESLVQQAS